MVFLIVPIILHTSEQLAHKPLGSPFLSVSYLAVVMLRFQVLHTVCGGLLWFHDMFVIKVLKRNEINLLSIFIMRTNSGS